MREEYGPEFVTITKEHYDSLVESQMWLTALEDAGVDNWPGIDEARQLHNEMIDNDE